MHISKYRFRIIYILLIISFIGLFEGCLSFILQLHESGVISLGDTAFEIFNIFPFIGVISLVIFFLISRDISRMILNKLGIKEESVKVVEQYEQHEEDIISDLGTNEEDKWKFKDTTHNIQTTKYNKPATQKKATKKTEIGFALAKGLAFIGVLIVAVPVAYVWVFTVLTLADQPWDIYDALIAFGLPVLCVFIGTAIVFRFIEYLK